MNPNKNRTVTPSPLSIALIAVIEIARKATNTATQTGKAIPVPIIELNKLSLLEANSTNWSIALLVNERCKLVQLQDGVIYLVQNVGSKILFLYRKNI